MIFFPNLRQNFNSFFFCSSAHLYKSNISDGKIHGKGVHHGSLIHDIDRNVLLGHHVHNIYYHHHTADSFLVLLQPRREAAVTLLPKMSRVRTNGRR